MSASLSRVRAIAISYGTVVHPVPTVLFQPAHALASNLVRQIWNDWGVDETGLRNKEIDLYSINIPMIDGLLSDEGLKVVTTRMWRNSYGRLFKSTTDVDRSGETVRTAGPDAQLITGADSEDPSSQKPLLFKFAPDMFSLINPSTSEVPVGTDGWALKQGWASVTPLQACFGEPGGQVQERTWQMKL
jgi:tubulin---tyrosine ligase